MLTKEHPVIHRYPWSREEKIIIAFFTLIVPIAVGVVLVTDSGLNTILASIMLALTWTIVFFLVRLGRKRKNASQLQAYMDDAVLFVTGFNLDETNAIDIGTVKSVSTKKHGLSDSFVFMTGGATSRLLVVPSRIAVQPGLREIVTLMLGSATESSKTAVALAQEIGLIGANNPEVLTTGE